MALTRIMAIALLLPAGVGVMSAQSASGASAKGTGRPSPISTVAVRSLALEHQRGATASAPQIASPWQPLLDFKDSDIKFNLQTLMNTLRDNRHEGWVLAAYPDPKTSRPLIGAGFSLDVPAREHPQRDPQNPNQFLEPSSAELWQAAGLEPERLQSLLEQYELDLSLWRKRKFQRKIRSHSLFPEITEEDATRLLRISAIQAVHNAKAYCRYFDQLSGPQQMALTQLVFQMGINLEEFTQFLSAINNLPATSSSSQSVSPAKLANASFSSQAGVTQSGDSEYWHAVQGTLIHSDWARRYSIRAVSVIAMFDPSYDADPWQAEARVRAEVHPLRHSHRRRHAATVRTASVAHKKPAPHRTHKTRQA